MGNTASITVQDDRPLTPIDNSSVMDPLSSRTDSCPKPDIHCMKPKKIARVNHERHIGEQNSQRKKYWPQTIGLDKLEREQIWVCIKGKLGYRRKENSESWASYTNTVLQSLLENIREETDDVVVSALSMPYEEYKHLLYLAYPWLQEVEKVSESKPQGAPGMRTWSLRGPAFDIPCQKCEQAGIHCEAKSIDSPVRESGGRNEIRGLRCKLCIASKNLYCNAWMHCWIGTRPVRGRPPVFVPQNEEVSVVDVANSLGKNKCPEFDSEFEDDETHSVAKNDDKPVQRLRSGFMDFVQQLQSRITAMEQEIDLLKQANAHLVQSDVSLRARNSLLENRGELAVQQADEGDTMSRKRKDDNAPPRKNRHQGGGVLNAETWKRSRRN